MTPGIDWTGAAIVFAGLIVIPYAWVWASGRLERRKGGTS
jgi:hypothetical protein